MSVQSTIQNKLKSAIKCTHLVVTNESNQHNVPPGSESHFKLIVVSDEFLDKSLVNRHRIIHEILSDELSNSIHALAIHAYTDLEWADKNNSAPESPPCMGGSK